MGMVNAGFIWDRNVIWKLADLNQWNWGLISDIFTWLYQLDVSCQNIIMFLSEIPFLPLNTFLSVVHELVGYLYARTLLHTHYVFVVMLLLHQRKTCKKYNDNVFCIYSSNWMLHFFTILFGLCVYFFVRLRFIFFSSMHCCIGGCVFMGIIVYLGIYVHINA